MMASPYKIVEIDNYSISNSSVEKFANVLALETISESYFIEIEDDIKEYMHQNSYSNEWHGHGGSYTGTLVAGCVRYETCKHLLDIYKGGED